jgi:hypothetical protein
MRAAHRPGTALRSIAVALAFGVALGGCDRPRSMGDTNQILVAAPQPVWAALESDLLQALEPRTFTVRDERVFDVAHIDPAEPGWRNLQLLRQVLVIGHADDPVVAEVLEEYEGTVPPPPSVIQVRNLWAQDQLVTLALLPDGADPTVARPIIGVLGQTFLTQYEEYTRARMYVTGINEELRDSLRNNAGFTLDLPRVYSFAQLDSTVYLFRNDQPDPSQLIRNITVDSRPGAQPISASELAEWRANLALQHTQPPQVTDSTSAGQMIEVNGEPALQVHGIWSNPPGEWPAAGPFITRAIQCPEQVFVIDAWLYAPGFAKYEYMYQLNTILDSFACAPTAS